MHASSARHSRSARSRPSICIVLGYPLAYVMSQLPPRIASLCMIGVLMPFWTSMLVRTYAWLVLLQRQGLINSWGIKLGLVGRAARTGAQSHRDADRHGAHHAAVPGAAALRLDARDRPRLPEGRGEPRRQSRRARSGWCSSRCRCRACSPDALIVFILCLGFYVTPALLGGGKVIMVANRIANDIEIFFNWGAASALGVVLLVLTAVILFVGGASGAARSPVRRARTMSWLDHPASETQISHRSRIWLYLAAVAVMAFLMLPTLIVVPMSFSASQYLEFPPRQWSLRWYENYFGSAAWMQATATSIKAGVLTAVVATPLGTLAAYGLFVVTAARRRSRDGGADDADRRAGDPGRHRCVLCLCPAQARQHADRPGAGAQHAGHSAGASWS